MSSDIAIKVNDVSKIYHLKRPKIGVNGEETREHWALKHLSFEVKKGDSVGIIGPNGSGKSTLLKILSGVTKPSSGSVEIWGRVASILDIGAGFHPELSGRENVFLNGQLLGFTKQEVLLKYDEIVAFSGIGAFIEEPVKNYSNGMYLRLAFSILAHLDFDIYLFDEVMSVGDASFTKISREKIVNLKTLGKTVIIISHNLSELSFCNHIIELNLGTKVQRESNQDALLNYATAAIEKTDVEVHQTPIKLIEFKNQVNDSALTLLSLELKQDTKENNNLSTKLPIYVEIEYYKHLKTDVLEPFLIVSDANGIVVFVSSPALSTSISTEQEDGKYSVSCEIPSGFLSSNIYTIGLTFVKSNPIFTTLPKNNQVSEDELKEAFYEYEIVGTYSNILYFRVAVVLENFMNLGKLNMPVGLVLPLLKWNTTKQKNS